MAEPAQQINLQRLDSESEHGRSEDDKIVPRVSSTSQGRRRRKELSDQSMPRNGEDLSNTSINTGPSQEDFPQSTMTTITEKSIIMTREESKAMPLKPSERKKASFDQGNHQVDFDPVLTQNVMDFDLIKQQIMQGEQKFARIQQAFRLEKEKKDAAEALVALLYIELKRLKDLSLATRMNQKKELLEKEVQLLEIKKQELSQAGQGQESNNEQLKKLIDAVEAMQKSLPPPAQQFSVMDNILKQLGESVKQQRQVLVELREEIEVLEKVKAGLEEDNDKLLKMVSKQQNEQADSNITSIDGLMTKIESGGYNSKTLVKPVVNSVPEEPNNGSTQKTEAPLTRKKGTIKIVGDALSKFMLPQSASHQQFNELKKEATVSEAPAELKVPKPEEMKNRSKSVSAKIAPGLHHFVLHTYKSPKKCHYCNETMWGKEFKCECNI